MCPVSFFCKSADRLREFNGGRVQEQILAGNCEFGRGSFIREESRIFDSGTPWLEVPSRAISTPYSSGMGTERFSLRILLRVGGPS